MEGVDLHSLAAALLSQVQVKSSLPSPSERADDRHDRAPMREPREFREPRDRADRADRAERRERRPSPAERFQRNAERDFHEGRPAPREAREERSFDRDNDFRAERPRRERSFEIPQDNGPSEDQERYRIEVGHRHRVKPGNIVGAIANEAGLDANFIGHINIQEDHSYVDLPKGMPREVLLHLKKVWVAGQQMRMSRFRAPKGKREFAESE